jgi:hypothetical protein
VRGIVVKMAWDRLFESNDHFLFGSRRTAVDLSTQHPDPLQIFRLWQIYIDNVNPLLKITHTATMQGRIIEATSNLANISPNLEAFMFSIYSMAVLSLGVDECKAKFGTFKEDLSTRYQCCCQQALLNAGLLRTNDRDCLTAFYLYLVIKPGKVLYFMRAYDKLGLDQTQNRSSLSVLHAWCGASYCTPNGPS